MYCVLPVLSAYLGHTGIRSTEKYLRLTKSIYPDITASMSAYTAGVYPEVIYEVGNRKMNWCLLHTVYHEQYVST